MEANPVRFMLEDYQPALDHSRTALAQFIGADPAGLVFVRNATEGVNAVLRSLLPRFGPGDELVITNHGYNACSNAARYVAEVTGAGIVDVEVPFPISTSAEILERIPTGVVFPAAEIVASVDDTIPVLIDGAHAPGMVPLTAGSFQAAFSVGNCHKWMCAPKGAGISSAFHAHFDWTGTDDPSARLSIPSAIDTVASHHPDGWPGVMATNHELVCAGRSLICDALAIAEPAPDEMLESMASIPVPADLGSDNIFDPLMVSLRHRHGIEVPVFTWPSPPHRLLRISAQLYNRIEDYRRLSEVLVGELA